MSTRTLPHSPLGYAPNRVAPGVKPPWTPGDWTRTGMAYSGRVQALRQPIGAVADVLTIPSGTYPGGFAYFGGILLPDGRVFCVPYRATTTRIYDPHTDTLTTPSGTYPGSDAYAGGVLLPDGRVFCVPHYVTTARIYGSANYQLSPARVLSTFDNKL